MQSDRKDHPKYFFALKLLYLSMMGLLFYLLYLSRRVEMYTVWDAIHPAFIPVFVVTTILLMAIILSAEKVEYKMLFTILHSVLSHVFMVVVFPAGNIGVQQTLLGKTRLVFDNVISNGFGWSMTGVLTKIYILFRGENLQSAFSVIFAHMFGVDVYWTHLLLVPILWGIFVPLIAFMISKTLAASERVSVLSCLLISLFPTSIVWGKESIPNGLSYLFFFCFIYFVLKHLKSNRSRDLFLAIMFFLATSLSHYLAGTVAFSLFLIVNAVKTYENDKRKSPRTAKLTLLISFIFCVSILPLALAYRRLFYPWADTRFSLQPLYELPFPNAFFYILLGNYFDFIYREAYITTMIFGAAPLLGLIGMMYMLVTSSKKRPNRSIDPNLLFIFLAVATIAVDDRILKLFMVNVPFVEADRLWVFRDFLLVSFVTIFVVGSIHEMRRTLAKVSDRLLHLLQGASRARWSLNYLPQLRIRSFTSVLVSALIFTIVSGWVTASVYYAYPHWAPLQTTSYELEAVKNIHETTKEKYIVIADQWIIFAGQMFAGINNPQAYYFSHTDPAGISLFIQMETNPTNETLIEAMETNNATIAYFIIEKPRLGTETYNDIINKAQQNNLQTYKIYYHPEDEEKLRIFYYKEH